MEDTLDLSIVIPMHNNENELAICLDSILLQSSPLTLECIVVDDGSTDASLEMARSYTKRFSQVRVISQPHAGAGVARNRGLASATGRYLWFVDADDYIAPDALREIQATMRSTDNDVDVFIFAREKHFLDEHRTEAMPVSWRNLFFRPEFEGRITNIEQNPRIAAMIFWPLHFLLFRRDFVNENKFRCSETMVMNDMLMAFSGICCARKLLARDKVIYIYCRRSPSMKIDQTAAIFDDRRLVCMAVFDSCDKLLKEKGLSKKVVLNYHISKAAFLNWTIHQINPSLLPPFVAYIRSFLRSLPRKRLLQLHGKIPPYHLIHINQYFIDIFLRGLWPGCPPLIISVFTRLPVKFYQKIHKLRALMARCRKWITSSNGYTEVHRE